MTTPLNGRQQLLDLFTQDPDKCRRAIQDIQRKAATEKKTRTVNGVYQAPPRPTLQRARLDYAKALSQNLFGSDENKKAALMELLKNKVQKDKDNNKSTDEPLPKSWAKLFDKIIDPAKGMKTLAAKDLSANQKQFAIVQGLWQQREDEMKQKLDQHNREIAQLNFNQLVAEIDSNPSQVAGFKNALRAWARQGSPRIQDLLKTANFTRDFVAWQEELIQGLQGAGQGQPRPALKPQFRLLIQKLHVFVNEIVGIRGAQLINLTQLTALSRGIPQPQIPVGVLALSGDDLNRLAGEGTKYDNRARVIELAVPPQLPQNHAPQIPSQHAQNVPRQPAQNQAQPITQQHLQNALANIQVPNQPVVPPPQAAPAPARDAAPVVQNNPAVAPAKAPAKNVVQQPAPLKPNAFTGFIKNCGNLLVTILTAPFRFLKWLFTWNKK